MTNNCDVAHIGGLYLPVVEPGLLGKIFSDWKSAHPRCGVLAFLPEAQLGDVEAIQHQARAYELPLMGAIFPALVVDAAFSTAGANLVCIDPCPPSCLVTDISRADSQALDQLNALVRSVADEVPSEDSQPKLFMIFDAILPNIGTILFELFSTAERKVTYAGVNAGSESFQPMACLFDENRIVGNGVLAMLLRPHHALALNHGYPTSKALFQATSTDGNRIDQIDGRPAMDVYRELVFKEFGVEVTPDTFYQYAVHYPLGLISALDVLVRIPVGFTDDGTIHCVGEIPPNAMLRLLHAPALAESDCVTKLARELGTTENQVIAFYCAGRRMHFGQQAGVELDTLRNATGAARLLGALSLGEIGTDPDLGTPEFHNAALVCFR